MTQDMLKDKVRGCLMAGAAGDALGYEVEFINRRTILSRFGERGITTFELDRWGKALISDDTQMTLFTANGLLNADRLQIDSIDAIVRAYLDWYYTQTPIKNKTKSCWLSDVEALYSLRAPGTTCMTALGDIACGADPYNKSKGCGGIMRVAPIALHACAHQFNDFAPQSYNTTRTAQLAAEASRCTHKHPLGFLPSALFAVLLHKILPLTPQQVREDIDRLVSETLDILEAIYPEAFAEDKAYLKSLTEKAVSLAHSDTSDADAISQLGEGWVAEETWAIALYCALRHIDSIEDAIIAAVNHNGDSDSTGSVCGNIMGAIYGYEHIKGLNMFCPKGKNIEDTLELAEIILTIADELSNSFSD